MYKPSLKALRAIFAELKKLIKTWRDPLIRPCGSSVPSQPYQTFAKLCRCAKEYSGLITKTSGDLPCICYEKALFKEITPVIRPCGPIFPKLPPNQGICVWYLEINFECCACYSYRVLATHESIIILLQNRNTPLSTPVVGNTPNSQKRYLQIHNQRILSFPMIYGTIGPLILGPWFPGLVPRMVLAKNAAQGLLCWSNLIIFACIRVAPPLPVTP